MLIILLFNGVFSDTCMAQLPLVTDNTGVQGKGNGQIEISNGLGFYNEHRCIKQSSEITPVFTYGINNTNDIVISYPFVFSTIIDDTGEIKTAGFSDINIEVKYLFYKNKKISFAAKPGISIPTGSFKDGFGSGKFSGSIFFISTLEFSSFFVNGNLGYLRNENKCGDALNIWHASIDVDYKLSDEFHFILNTGVEKDPDILATTNPVFGLLGLYYCINDNCEISLGYYHDFKKEETNHSFIYGLTLRF